MTEINESQVKDKVDKLMISSIAWIFVRRYTHL